MNRKQADKYRGAYVKRLARAMVHEGNLTREHQAGGIEALALVLATNYAAAFGIDFDHAADLADEAIEALDRWRDSRGFNS